MIKRDTGDFIEADDIVLADQTPLAIAVIHKHPREVRQILRALSEFIDSASRSG